VDVAWFDRTNGLNGLRSIAVLKHYIIEKGMPPTKTDNILAQD